MLDDPQRHAVALERWLSSNDVHRDVYKRVAIEIGYASDAATQFAFDRADPVDQTGLPSRRRRHVAAWATLAAATAAATGFIMTPRKAPYEAPPPAIAQTSGPQAILATSPRDVVLADGSKVSLGQGSTIVVRFDKTERRIDLQQGKARFFVSHNAALPFVVYVPGGKVTAVGTIFEVDSSSSIPKVRLISGRVIVTMASKVQGSRDQNVTLHSGDEISLDPSAPFAARRRPPSHCRT